MASHSASGAATPKSKLDSLSKEDLIRFVKKQVGKLKQTQREASDLHSELDLLRAELKNAQECRERDRQSAEEELCSLRAQVHDATDQVESGDQLYSDKCQAHCRLQTECLVLRQALSVRHHHGLDGDSDGGALARHGHAVVGARVEHASRADQQQATQTEHVGTGDMQCQTDDVPEHNAESSKSQEELALRDAEIQRVKRELAESHNRINSLQEAMSERAMLSLEAADWERDVARAKCDLHTAVQRAELAEHAQRQTKAELDEILEQKQAEEQQRAELKSAGQQLNDELNETRGQIALANEQLVDCQTKLQSAMTEVESLKLQLSESVASLDHSKSRLLTAERSARQHKESDARATDAFATLQTEFDQYKARVAVVLREREQKESAESECWRGERDTMRLAAASLQTQLDDATEVNNRLNNELSVARAEIQALAGEVSKLKSVLDEEKADATRRSDMERRTYEQRLETAVQLKNNELGELATRITELESSSSRECAAHAAKECDMRGREQELRERLRDMQSQVDSMRAQARQQGHGRRGGEPAAAQRVHDERQSTNSLGSCSIDAPSDAASQSRSNDGTPTPRAAHHATRGRTPPTLDELLSSPAPAHSSMDNGAVAHGHGELRSPAAAAGSLHSVGPHSRDSWAHSATLAHMSALLRDAEETAERHGEQIDVLKAEIRRLNRNEERQEHMAHCEYVKNVVVKFITTPSAEQRGRLVPVLTTLLRLSADELALVKKVASADSDAANAAAPLSSWSTYLHRWSATS